MIDSFPTHTKDTLSLRGSDNFNMVEKDYMHTGNNRVYTVVDIIWNGDDDTWSVLHKRPGTNTLFVRSLSNFNGNRKKDVKRFIQIKED